MNIRDKQQIDSTLKKMKYKEGESNRKFVNNLEEKLKSNRERHPEPAPNSLISGLLQKKNGHKA